MKAPNITNAHVDPPSFGSDRMGAGFDYRGARFHVWIVPDERGRPQFDSRDGKRVLYKNPPAGVKRDSLDNFPTRRLDATSAPNVRLINELFRQVVEGDMIAKARAAADVIENKRLAEAHAEWAVQCKHDAGPQLYAVLLRIRATFVAGDIAALIPDTMKEIEEALAAAEGKGR